MTPKPITMVEIPPGSAVISDQRTGESWTVDVDGFLLASTPVTVGQYRSLAEATAAADAGQVSEAVGTAEPARQGSGADRADTADSLPITEVSWLDAVAFCNRLSESEGRTPAYLVRDGDVRWIASSDGYRLPTEAEWVHACRAGSSGPRYGDLDTIAWYRANSRGSAQPVGGRAPNAWGLYDMLGNVFEWCWDLYDPAVYGTYRVLKGGGWADPPWSCRAGVRRRSMETFAIDDVGFRVARSSAPRSS
ncbi:SUMF1/EgtB/PvdO family nonheme iron enzyme [Brevibacterium daeguense]|uniref:SUMF1/EgtB/PvdO family nonheme iron enzyme n=1 Tax=Brevibacterium daeguense TaxID=909936 RepID=A0ABP8EIK3_9MICO|nr:SUMF1/EgtB/PvdO family nonheme iron enzyme [Brevibacterium daeguense]